MIGAMKGAAGPLDVKISAATPAGNQVLVVEGHAGGYKRRERLPGETRGDGQAQRRPGPSAGGGRRF